jgi:Predicted Fe-S oxidoreductase
MEESNAVLATNSEMASLSSLTKYPEMKYLAYFQSYTNTYDSIEKLIESV